MKKSIKHIRPFQTFLRVIISFSALVYILIFIDEVLPPYDPDMRESYFGIFMGVFLFAWFGYAYIKSWHHERAAGWLFIFWYILLIISALFIWQYGHATILLGWPVAIFGILFILHAKRLNKA